MQLKKILVMKYILLLLLFAGLVSMHPILAQTNTYPTTGSAGIGTLTPDASAILEVSSTLKGLLLPRMTKTQRDAIASPAIGLLIYQTNSTRGFYMYNGSVWTAVTPLRATTTLNNLAVNTAINQSLVPGVPNDIDLGSALYGWRNLFVTGKIGVATNTPMAVLDVNGDALINGLVIGRGGGNDTSNVAVGFKTLLVNNSQYNGNTAVGSEALMRNTTGYLNTSNGYKALSNNDEGYGNTASGVNALFSNTTGFYNVACGLSALSNNKTGGHNTVSGAVSMFNNTSGTGNTASGLLCMFNNTQGSNNTAIGNQAMYTNTVGYNNTAIGIYADVSHVSLKNTTALGASAIVNTNNKVRIGNSTVTIVESAVGSWTTSDGRFKNNITEEVKGLEFINLLRPVVYNFDSKKYERFVMQNFSENRIAERLMGMEEDLAKATAIRRSGFIAQEVLEAAKKVGYDYNGVHIPETPTDNFSLSYEKLVVPLVKAVQELSVENGKLKMENEKLVKNESQLKMNDTNLQQQIDELKEAMMKLLATKTPCTSSK